MLKDEKEQLVNEMLVLRMENVALLMAQIAEFNARIAGMVAINQQRAFSGEAPAYAENEFAQAIGEFPDPMVTLKRGL
jgi:hypothetical protein